MSNPNRLTTREVARLCRVSDATVKRWAAAGLIESEKTNGGHRRFRAEDVARFQCQQRLGLSQQNGDNSIATTATRSRHRKELGGSRLFRSLICGCEEEVANQIIKRSLDGESLGSIFDNTLSVELERVGQLWVEGKISVAEEHLASQAVCFALYKLRNVLPAAEPTQKLAFCFGIEGDYHGLATDFSRMIFESLGWTVLNFGPNTPLFSLHAEILEIKPDMICISACLMDSVERLTHDYSSLLGIIDRSNTKIALGGRAFQGEGINRRFPADVYLSKFSQLEEFIKAN